MTKRLTSSPPNSQKRANFGEVSFDTLSDCLTILNNKNKCNVENASNLRGHFKNKRVVERIFHVCEEFGLEPLVGYHATEMLDRFMVMHIENLLSRWKIEVCESSPCGAQGNAEEWGFQSLKGKFAIFIVCSVQIASKLSLHSNVISSNSASKYLQLLGISCDNKNLLEAELLILKTLDFRLNVPNPLSFVETLLEVLCHNDPDTPVAHLHHVCRSVLQFVYLQRETIYHSLLVIATRLQSPSLEQRAKFVPVTEDFMLLGVGVITVAAFISQTAAWKKVVQELSEITGISAKSIIDFTQATLTHIVSNKAT